MRIGVCEPGAFMSRGECGKGEEVLLESVREPENAKWIPYRSAKWGSEGAGLGDSAPVEEGCVVLLSSAWSSRGGRKTPLVRAWHSHRKSTDLLLFEEGPKIQCVPPFPHSPPPSSSLHWPPPRPSSFSPPSPSPITLLFRSCSPSRLTALPTGESPLPPPALLRALFSLAPVPSASRSKLLVLLVRLVCLFRPASAGAPS